MDKNKVILSYHDTLGVDVPCHADQEEKMLVPLFLFLTYYSSILYITCTSLCTLITRLVLYTIYESSILYYDAKRRNIAPLSISGTFATKKSLQRTLEVILPLCGHDSSRYCYY